MKREVRCFALNEIPNPIKTYFYTIRAVLGDMNGYTLAFTHEAAKRAYKLSGAPSTILD